MDTSTYEAGPLRFTLPDLTTFQPVAAAITVVALVLIFVVKWPMLRVLAVCAVLGAGAAVTGLPVS